MQAVMATVLGLALIAAIVWANLRLYEARNPSRYRGWALVAYIVAITALGAVALNVRPDVFKTTAKPAKGTSSLDGITVAPWLAEPTAKDALGAVGIALMMLGLLAVFRRRRSLPLLLAVLSIGAVTIATTAGQTTNTKQAGLSNTSATLILVLAAATLIAMLVRNATRAWLLSAFVISAITVAVASYPPAPNAPGWPKPLLFVALGVCLILAVVMGLQTAPQPGEAAPTALPNLFTVVSVALAAGSVFALVLHHKGSGKAPDVGIGVGATLAGVLVAKLIPFFLQALGFAAASGALAGSGGPDELDRQVADSMEADKRRQEQYDESDRQRRASKAAYEAERSRRLANDSSLSRSERDKAASDRRRWDDERNRNR